MINVIDTDDLATQGDMVEIRVTLAYSSWDIIGSALNELIFCYQRIFPVAEN